MKLYNTLSRQIEELKPLNPPTVKIYSCGPTVYNYLHIGNWAAYIYWDVLVRALILDGYKPERVINLTDVGHLTSDADEGEDKLVKKAREQGLTAWDIAEQYISAFKTGFDELNLIPPMKFARATDFINEQLELVRKLKQARLTYQIDDGIYLDTAKVKNYGQLARLDIESLKAGARVEYNQAKHSPSDFAVWKFALEANRDMQWSTPIDLLDEPTDAQGNPYELMGFPGWHLECSAIILNTLGEQIDIHTGGIDHIPVHHTNEIAQTESITGKPMATFWVHNNHLKSDGTKISKSLGNGYTLDDLAERGFSAMDLKMLILQGHYQKEGNFSFKALTAAKNRLAAWREIASYRHQIYDDIAQDHDKTINFLAVKHHILDLANDNLNTPQILAVIDEAWQILRSPNTNFRNINRQSLVDFLNQIDSLLGLDLINSTPDIDEALKRLIIERQIAKEQRNFERADQLRQELLTQGIELIDTKNQTLWKRTATTNHAN
ncbi:MAG: cysteine--tRNA ligase [Candidatus Saccharibacteria bacterium]|nr:cysteine--tRNA ligase [Candidatus Saccharibacteria bacterium]